MRSFSQSTEVESSAAQHEASSSNQNQAMVSNQMLQERQSNEQKTEAFQEATKDLGTINSLNEATSLVGSLIDALIPRNGDTASLSVNFNIPVHPLVKITISLTGWAGRFGGNVILNSSIGLGAKLEGSVKALWLEMQAYLAVSGTGYIKAMGENGAEAFEFMGLAIREVVAQHNESIASYMMDSNERSTIISHMNDGEYAEVGLGVNVSAGASADTSASSDVIAQGTEDQVESEASGNLGVSASAGYMRGLKFSNENNDGELEESSTAKASGSIGLNLDLAKFGLSNISGNTNLSVDVFYNNDEISKILTNIAFSATIQPKNFGWGFLAGCFSEVTLEMIKILRNGEQYFEGSTAVRLGKIADSMSRLSITDNVASTLGNQMSEELWDNMVSFQSKTQLAIKMIWGSDGNCTLILKASKVTSTGVNLGVASVNAALEDTLFEHKIPFQA